MTIVIAIKINKAQQQTLKRVVIYPASPVDPSPPPRPQTSSMWHFPTRTVTSVSTKLLRISTRKVNTRIVKHTEVVARCIIKVIVLWTQLPSFCEHSYRSVDTAAIFLWTQLSFCGHSCRSVDTAVVLWTQLSFCRHSCRFVDTAIVLWTQLPSFCGHSCHLQHYILQFY